MVSFSGPAKRGHAKIVSRKPGGETAAHYRLKRAALCWAQQQGYKACAFEMRVPNSNFRADLAAFRAVPKDQAPPKGGIRGQTAIFECKQSRPDFLNHSRGLEETLNRLEDLNRRRSKLERLLGLHYPTLRHNDSLFPEYCTVDAAGIRHAGYSKLIKEISILEARVYGKTKFDRLRRWRSANLLYVVAPLGLFEPGELPAEWGLLSPAEDDEAAKAPRTQQSPENSEVEFDTPPELTVVRPPRFLENSNPAHAETFLHQIAITGTGRLNKEAGVDYAKIFPHLP